MLPSFEQFLSKKSIIKNRSVLSPYYVPNNLPFREKEIGEIMKYIAPALKGQPTRNIIIYGKTGTGKTSSVKYIIREFNNIADKYKNTNMIYTNCRIYNSRYRVFQKLISKYYPTLDKQGFGVSFFYEKLLDKMKEGNHLIVILDEVDVVKDLDDLIYSLVRINEESEKGNVSIIAISNKLSFKKVLDPRTRSSLNDIEMIFPPYDAIQLYHILKERAIEALEEDAITDSALSLIAAITSQENGDARYALKLLLKSAEIAEDENKKISEEIVQKARELVDYDLVAATIKTLPINQQILIYTIAKMTLSSKYKKLGDDQYLFSGDIYNAYVNMSKKLGKKPKSARWYREYINELENVGLISTVFSSKGIRGHTRLIRIGNKPTDIIKIIETILGIKK